MNDLIEALTIFLKYTQTAYPTSCEHDVMYVHVKASEVSFVDKQQLSKLGFEINEEYDNFYSLKYGSC